MNTKLVPLGKGYYEGSPQTLDAGQFDRLLLVGGRRALIHIEVQYDDGTDNPSDEPKFRPWKMLRGLDPTSCTELIEGPIVYRTVRSIDAEESGCNVIGQNA